MFREQMQEDRLVAVPGLRLVKVIEAVTTNGDGSGGGAENRRKKRDIGGGGRHIQIMINDKQFFSSGEFLPAT